MIYRLQRKFIVISTVSVLSVILLIFAIITALNFSYMNRNLDVLADKISDGGGKFPSDDMTVPRPGGKPPQGNRDFDFITPETPFATRHFTVFFDEKGLPVRVNTDSIASIDRDAAVEYAQKVREDSDERGWIDSYRYKKFSQDGGTAIAFIDGGMNRASTLESMAITGFVLLGSAALILLLIFLLSKRVVKPIAESYEKQKQFVTDANHELKTPLTLILANVDIAESELGKSEWLDDIRAEGYRMTALVNQLVSLSRMDEDGRKIDPCEINFSEMVEDAASEFIPLAESEAKRLTVMAEPDIRLLGDEILLRRLISVLLDNAVKYCDENGEIELRLQKHRHVILTVENTFFDVDNTELDRLFDRFYRADRARTHNGSYGIGLSIAKAIAEKHKGSITAYKKDSSHIGFKVVL